MSQASTPSKAAPPLASLAVAAVDAARAGETVQVIFDLDDTLFLVRPRKRAIFREIASELAADAALHDALHRLAGSEIPYDVKEALGTVGIEHPSKVAHIKDAFFARFFDGSYTRHDAPNDGAAAYLAHLHTAGVRIVYLTGRPDDMRAMTIETLLAHGFPWDAATELVMKAADEAHLGDAEFKGVKASEIAANGRVLGVFDNEPANLNAILPAAPDALYCLLDTDHSPNPPALAMTAHVFKDFSSARKQLAASLAVSPEFAGHRGWTLDVQQAG